MNDGNAFPYIGFDKLYVAELLSEDEHGGTYGDIRQLPGAVSATVTPETVIENFYADDGVYAQVTSSVLTEIKLTVANISNANFAWLMGARYDDETGQLLESSKDVPRTVALGYRAQLANGTHDYVWRLAGVFAKPKRNYHTKEEKIKYSEHELVFNARPLMNGDLVNAFSSDDEAMMTLGLDDVHLGSASEGFFCSPNFVAHTLGNGINDLTISTPSGEDVEEGDLNLSFGAAEGAIAILVQIKDVSGKWVRVNTLNALNASSVNARVRTNPALIGGNTYTVRLVTVGGAKAGASNVVHGIAASF